MWPMANKSLQATRDGGFLFPECVGIHVLWSRVFELDVSRTMSAPMLYGGIGSLVVGLLFVIFPKPIGIGFCRFGQFTWKGHENDWAGKIRQEVRKTFPAFSPDYDEAKAPNHYAP